jgi:hypothetical protein
MDRAVTEASSSGSTRLYQPIVCSTVRSEQAIRNQTSDPGADLRMFGFTDIRLSRYGPFVMINAEIGESIYRKCPQ